MHPLCTFAAGQRVRYKANRTRRGRAIAIGTIGVIEWWSARAGNQVVNIQFRCHGLPPLSDTFYPCELESAK